MTTKKSLEVNFHGPIAFRLCKKEAWAYLPMCRNHACNILTDCNDISPKMHLVLDLKGPTAAPTKIGNGLEMVGLDWQWGNGPKAKECYCIFKLPSPDLVFGLRAEYVKIDVPGGGKSWPGKPYARGLRFYYDECKVAPKITPLNGAAAGDFRKFDAKYFGHSDLYQVEIRFHDTKYQPTVDHHHRDAMMCSRKMRELFPPCDKWKVNFEPPKNLIDRIGGKYPVDCGANAMVLTDGIRL